MDDFIPVSPRPGSAVFDPHIPSMARHGPTSSEFTESSGNYLNSLLNSSELKLPHEEKYDPSSEAMHSPLSFVNQHQSSAVMFSLPSLESMPYTSAEMTIDCEHCGNMISKDKLKTHLQRCSPRDQLSVDFKHDFADIKPVTTVSAVAFNGDEQVVHVNWEKYMRTLQVKMAPDYNFASKSYTFDVPGLDPGMKLEAIDKNNPQSFCVATVIEIIGHRVRIRYDGYGRDSSHDFWCNFQAEELYPIGWCAQNAFPLQPPTGISCTLEEWRKFLTKTLTGALAAPKHLFPSEHFQPKVHSFEVGMKLEIIHPSKPCVICVATVVKSLGPYFFLVSTEIVDNLPSVTVCCHSDSSNIFPPGWSYKNGIELSVPSGYKRKSFSWEKYIASCRGVYAPAHLFKKFRPHKFRTGHKVEAVDLEHPQLIRVATVTNVIGSVLQLYFDGQSRFQFVESDSPDIHGFGWCKRTGHPLLSPYGKVPFKTVSKYEGSELCPKQLKLISFEDVIGRKPNAPVVCKPENPSFSTTAMHYGTPRDPLTSFDVDEANIETSSNVVTTAPCIEISDAAQPEQDKLPLSPQDAEHEEISEDKNEKYPALSPSDDDDDVSDDDTNATSSERFYHNKNQIYFNKSCCCGPLLNPDEVKLLPDATETGKVSAVIRIALEMVAKCAKDPERVLEMMQEGSGVRLTIKHNGKTFKKVISRIDSRPKLERYLKRFCRRLVCCEYFLSLTPLDSSCPDDCKADQFGNLQGPKGMKAKRAREYFETKHLGYEKKRRGRQTKTAANEIAAQRAAAGIVTSVFQKGNHVPLPNLNLPVTAIADQLRSTAAKILHQVQANQGLSSERSVMPTKMTTSSPAVVTQTRTTLSTPLFTTPHPTNPMPTNRTDQSRSPCPSPTSVSPSTTAPIHGRPRLLPSPYGPPPLSITSTAPETSACDTADSTRRGSYNKTRTSNTVSVKKIVRPIVPAGPVPERSIPLVEIPVIIPPPANKLPLPAKSTAIPVTPITTDNSTPLPSSAKQVFRLAQPKFVGKTATSFSGRLFAVPKADGNFALSISNKPSQTTTLVTANQRPIPASVSLTRSGPPPLIPTRSISGNTQIITPRLIEGKLLAAAPNVCVTEQGTFVAAQLKPVSGVSPHSLGQTDDANAMMKKMFSVVRSDGTPVTFAPVKFVEHVRAPAQVAHIRPYEQSTNNSQQSTTNSFQSARKPNQNSKSSFQNTNKPCQKKITNKLKKNTFIPFQNTKKFASIISRPSNSTVGFDKNTNAKNAGGPQKFSLNVGGGMGAVTTAVRSGMLARENCKLPEGSPDSKHDITLDGGYSVKIAENNLETNPGVSGAYSTVTNDSAIQANITSYPSGRTAVIAPNNAALGPNISDVDSNNSEFALKVPDAHPTISDGVLNESEHEPNTNMVSMKKRSVWMFRKRKKKKVRFTYAKRNGKKRKEQGNGLELAGQEGYEEYIQGYEGMNSDEMNLQDGNLAKRQRDNDNGNKESAYLSDANRNNQKRVKRSSDSTNSSYPIHDASSYMNSPQRLTGVVVHAVQSSQHPSVKIRSSGAGKQQSNPLHSFSIPPKRARFLTDSVRKQRVGVTGTKSWKPKVSVNASTNTSLPGCPGDKCLWLADNPKSWSIEEVGEYLAATDCKNYATYFMDQEIDGQSLLMLTRSTLMQFTNMKLGPTLKLSNYIAQLRARVGMSKHT